LKFTLEKRTYYLARILSPPFDRIEAAVEDRSVQVKAPFPIHIITSAAMLLWLSKISTVFAQTARLQDGELLRFGNRAVHRI